MLLSSGVHIDIQALHISRSCRLCYCVKRRRFTLQSRGERVCGRCARRLPPPTFSSVQRCTNSATLVHIGEGIFIQWRERESVCVCVECCVHSHQHRTNTWRAEGLTGVTAQSTNVKSFSRSCWCGHFTTVSLRASHFLKAPLKRRKNKAQCPLPFILSNKPELKHFLTWTPGLKWINPAM